MFIEYPKALYKDGIGSSFEELPYVVVNNGSEESAKNAEGWFEIGKGPSTPFQAEKKEPEKRRGRPPKVEA